MDRLNQNNFDLLRILFASTVCLVHCYELSGYQQLAWIVNIFSSAIAVKAFFVVSGFLIFMSYEKSISISSYFGKRLRRIYPAYVFVILLSAFCLFGISSVDMSEYFDRSWVMYLISNLTFLNFLQPTLPGVFEMNRLATVNGALWTLKIEVMFYISVPLFVLLFRRFGHLRVMLVTYFLSFAFVQIMGEISEIKDSSIIHAVARQFPGQLTYFMAGALAFYYRGYFELHAKTAIFTAMLVLLANKAIPLPLVEPIALGVVVVFMGLFCFVGNFGKHGDFSYGVYILHFPIVQTLLWAKVFDDSPWLFLGAVFLLTLAGSYLLWNLVEKKFLLKRNHYMATPAH